MTDHEILIRQAVEAEADQAPHAEAVLSRLRTARRKPVWPRFAIVAAAAAVVVAAVVVPSMLKDNAATDSPIAAPPARVDQNVLLVGMDGQGMADSLVLARVRVDGGISGVSLPRDTVVDEEKGWKLGSIHGRAVQAAEQAGAADDAAALAGRDALVASVQALTGVRAEHVAIVDTLSFVGLTDAVGGVRVCLVNAVKDKYSGVDLPAGEQTLSGEQALAFLRQRHNLPNGDLDRIARAAAFLGSLSEQLQTSGVLSDPQRLKGFLDAVGRAVRTDPGWDLVAFAATVTAQAPMDTKTIPYLSSEFRTETGASGISVDKEAVRAFTAEQLSGAAGGGGGAGGGTSTAHGCVN
ncbi:LCP family protein [Actinokineospora pegani]|uniref:LCP family protein n=1 Tax=Actinokineospora pegani TaxID=2654637 RepID=UPI0012E9FB28|nr:LCP family protein [Actinokineospora pegani]